MVSKPQGSPTWPERLWLGYLTGDHSDLGPMVSGVKAAFKHVPAEPRCRVCNAPFGRPGRYLSRAMGFGPGSSLNPTLCVRCEKIVTANEVGAEVELSLMFADVRGSTALAQELGHAEFQKVIDRFYRTAVDALVSTGALVEKLIGDEVAGIYAPGIAGADHAAKATQAAVAILEGTGHRDPDGPWVCVGAGVHSGIAYVGAVGSGASMSVITVLGDTPNTAARLASSAGTGEIYISEDACTHGIGTEATPVDSLELKGRQDPLPVRMLRVGPA